MKVLSLFSGVGGFDMGLENAGMQTVFQCEWDKHANSILHKHWPDVPKWDDVSTLTGKHILAHAPVIDVVAWGSPCQDLSGANTNRTGLEGKRSGLYYEGIRIIKELQEESNGQYPRISIWENVVGALSSNRGADFGVILDEMAEAGALAIEWSVLDAQYFGVPQRRRRVFVIAIFDPVLASRSSNPLLPVSKSLPGDIAKGKQARQNTSRSTTKSTRTSNAIIGSDIVGSLNTSDAKMISSQYVNENKCVVEPFVKSSRAQTSEDSETWIPGEVNPTLNSFDVGDTRATTAIIQPVLFENSYRDGARIANDGVTQTLTSKMGTGGGNTPMIAQSVAYSIREDAKANNFSATELDHANSLSALRPSPQSHHAQMFIAEPTMAVRRLTPLECERLMGWPDDHTRYKADGTEQADTHRYKQCGNGVASPVAQWIAKHILNI
jgi:DNA (cytosine-5)-methyltransferase 1